MFIAPQTKFSQVIDQINDILRRGEYADPDVFAVRAIRRECERVRDIDPARGWALLSCYHSLLGESDEVDRCFKASERLGKLPIAVSNYHANLTNLGYFSRAHAFFRDRAGPETGNFSGLASLALSSGSIRTFVSFHTLAAEMKMELPKLPIDKAERAANVLAAAGLSDERVALHLDAAGVVLRKHKLFFEGDGEIQICDDPGLFMGVTCIYRLNRSPEEVFELNVELAMAEEQMMVEKAAAFDVLFLPV